PIGTVGNPSASVGPSVWRAVSRGGGPPGLTMPPAVTGEAGILDTGSVRRGWLAEEPTSTQAWSGLAKRAAEAGRSSPLRAGPAITADASAAPIDGAWLRSGTGASINRFIRRA